MINTLHVREVVIGPVLGYVGVYDRHLEELLIETGFWESTFCGLWSNEEIDRPQGLGMWGITQVEHHATARWMAHRETWSRAAAHLVPAPSWQHVAWNLAYAALMAAAMWHMRAPEEGRWPPRWEDRHQWWERYWMEEPGFMLPQRWKKRLRLLREAERPVSGQHLHRHHQAPRVGHIPGRWRPAIEFAIP